MSGEDAGSREQWVVAAYDSGVDGRGPYTVTKIVGPFATEQEAIDASKSHYLRVWRLTPPSEACRLCPWVEAHPVHATESKWYGAHPFAPAHNARTSDDG